VFNRAIPIVIKNTFNPTAPGTTISDRPDADDHSASMPYKGVSSIADTPLIQISGNHGADNQSQITTRALNAFAESGISVFSSSHTPGRGKLSLAVNLNDSQRALKALEEEFAPELAAGLINPINIIPEMSTVAIVGRNMKSATPLASSLVSSMAEEQIPITGYSQGASDTTLSFVVPKQNLRQAIQIAHDCCFTPNL
jgi:aspartokinase/homoserine dehydrogenase 1